MKIKKIFIFYTIPLMAISPQLHKKIQASYCPLSSEQKRTLLHALYILKNTPPYIQASAAHVVAKKLQKNINLKEKALIKADDYQRPLIKHNMNILIRQQDELQAYVRTVFHHTPWYKKWFYQFMHLAATLLEHCAHMFNLEYQSPRTQTLNALQDYIHLEQEIFENYQQTQFFIALQSLHTFPEILQFWNHPQSRFTLLQGVKKHELQPEIQAADLDVLGATVEATKDAAAAAAEEATGTMGELTEEGAAGVKAAKNLSNAKKALTETTDEETTGDKIAKDVEEDMKDPDKSTPDKTLPNKPPTLEEALQELKNELKQINKTLSEALPKTLENLTSEEILEQTTNTLNKFADLQEKILNALKQQLEENENFITENKNTLKGEISTGAKKTIKKAIKSAIKQKTELCKIARNALRDIQKEANSSKEILNQMENSEKSIQNLKLYIKGVQTEIENVTKMIPPTAFETHADMVLKMGLQMLVMQGGSLAIQWTNAADAEKMAQLTQQQATIQGNFNAQQAQAQAELLSQEKAVERAGSATISAILNTKSNATFAQQKTYLQQAIITQNINQIAFTNPFTATKSSQTVAELDQNFYVSSMLTPALPVRTITKTSLKNNIEPLWQIIKKPLPLLVPTQWQTWQIAQPKFLSSRWIINLDQSNANAIQPSNQLAMQNVNQNNLLPPLKQSTTDYDHTWYNLYRLGNWQFNDATQSFYQYQAVPIPLQDNASGFYNCRGGGAYNSIFTEYIPPLSYNANNIPSYEIEIEVQVYTAHYPFFAGILFNGARWISGVLSPLDQNRIVGLYGTPEGTITLTSAETFYIQSSDKNLQSIQAISPLMQIMTSFEQWKNQNVSSKQPLTWTEINNSWQKVSQQSSIKNPLYDPSQKNSSKQTPLQLNTTYIISVITQPEAFMITLLKKNDQNENGTNTSQNDNQNIIAGPFIFTNRNGLVGIYHSLGFVAPGCSARFSIIKPKALTYSKQALNTFAQSFNNQVEQSSSKGQS